MLQSDVNTAAVLLPERSGMEQIVVVVVGFDEGCSSCCTFERYACLFTSFSCSVSLVREDRRVK
jgi:hypothetical protein